MRRIAVAATLGVLVGAACNSKIEDKPELIEDRIAGCEKLCRVMADPVCGTPASPNVRHWEMQECVEECATADGDISGGWGYEPSTGEDACTAEWHKQTDCIAALSCEDQRLYYSGEATLRPEDEQPCYSEVRAMLDCAQAASEGGGN